MNTKKTPRKNLENKKSLFLEIGFAIALTGVLLAFQYRITERTLPDIPGSPELMIEQEIIENIIPPKPEPPKPPDPTTFTPVPDETEIDEPTIDINVDVFQPNPELLIPDLPVYVEPEFGDEAVDFAEIMPEFPGGEAALRRYLANTLQYPRIAIENRIQGTVFVSFVVERDGSISEIRVLRGIGGGCDEEAIRAIQNMPRWKPGRQGAHPVRVRYNLPVAFRLR